MVSSAPTRFGAELYKQAGTLRRRVAGRHTLGAFKLPGAPAAAAVRAQRRRARRLALVATQRHSVPLAGVDLGFGERRAHWPASRQRGQFTDAGAPILLDVAAGADQCFTIQRHRPAGAPCSRSHAIAEGRAPTSGWPPVDDSLASDCWRDSAFAHPTPRSGPCPSKALPFAAAVLTIIARAHRRTLHVGAGFSEEQPKPHDSEHPGAARLRCRAAEDTGTEAPVQDPRHGPTPYFRLLQGQIDDHVIFANITTYVVVGACSGTTSASLAEQRRRTRPDRFLRPAAGHRDQEVKGGQRQIRAVFSDADSVLRSLEQFQNIDNITVYTFLYRSTAHRIAARRSKGPLSVPRRQGEGLDNFFVSSKLPDAGNRHADQGHGRRLRQLRFTRHAERYISPTARSSRARLRRHR